MRPADVDQRGPASGSPLVSVLTPSYNQRAYLPDNLGSVSRQTYPHIEHIVMDGGSTDGSVELLESAGPNVRWRSEPDRGQAHAINKAFADSSGEIVGWLNSDDAYFDSEVVADVVRFFDRHPEADVVYGHVARVSADGRVIYIIWVPPFAYGLLRSMCFLEQPGVFFRRRAIEEEFLDESFHFAMDWELWLRLGRARRFVRMSRIVAIDRIQPERKMKTQEAVLEADRARLGEMYGVRLPWYYFRLWSLLTIVSRVAGGRYALKMSDDLVFGGAQDDRWTLFKRQVASRQSRWPQEWR